MWLTNAPHVGLREASWDLVLRVTVTLASNVRFGSKDSIGCRVGLNRAKIQIHDRKTCVRLEPEFWFYLRQVAAEQACTAKALIEAVEKARTPGRSLSSALRVYVTGYLHDHPLPC